jgi:hypothetical protein
MDLVCFKPGKEEVFFLFYLVSCSSRRFDVPRDWPELLPALSDAVQSGNDTVQHRFVPC